VKWNKKIFVEKAKKVHGEKYDYSQVDYVNSRTLVKIKCEKHGIFEQLPSNHIRKYGCPLCAIDNRTMNHNVFIKKAKKVHGEKYDYSQVDYVNNHTKVAIICKNHGIFLQEPQNHLRGHGCPICMVDNHISKHSFNNEIFIDKAKKVHGNKYDYSKVEYVSSLKKVCIICPKHGEFWQSYNSHIHHKNGCPICKLSKGEIVIEKFLKDNKIEFISQYNFDGCSNKRKLSFDFYIPEYNTCIEYDGIQHFYHVPCFGSYKKFCRQQECDKIKNVFCQDNNIELIRISYKQNIKMELNKWLKEKISN